ncbi:MAG: carboxypeptidase regulatory-like domain-containing protein [Planctomycetes bacterium]|nr:carboxypeptidase regulatory-like domain-containing protein [Planctomycetota bacterium]
MDNPTTRVIPFVLGGAALALAALVFFLLRAGGPGADDAPTLEPAPAAEAPVVVEPQPAAAGSGASAERSVAEAEPTPAPLEGPPASFLAALGGITGRLVEKDGAPVPDMSVELLALSMEDILLSPQAFFAGEESAPSFLRAGTRSDAEGRFRFAALDPRGIHGLGVDLGGPRATLRFVDISPRSGEESDLGDVVLEPYITFTGKVVDLAGGPVPDARVRATDLPPIAFQFGAAEVRPDGGVLFQAGSRNAAKGRWKLIRCPPRLAELIERFPVPTTYSAGDGAFTLAGVPQGLVTVLVDKDEFVTLVKGPLPTGAAGGTRDIGTLVLDEGDVLSGRVEDSEGVPVPDAEVMIGPRHDVPGMDVVLVRPAGATGADGRFLAAGVADREHYVAARRAGALEWTVVDGVFPGGEEPVLRLEPAYDLKLTVLDPQGEVVKRPEIRLSGMDHEETFLMAAVGGALPRLRTDVAHLEDGSLEIKGIGSGRCRVLIKAPGFAVKTEEVDLSQGPKEVTVTLEVALLLAVRVVAASDGAPVPFASVSASARAKEFLDFPAPVASARTDEEGRAELEGIAADGCRLKVSHPGYGLHSQEVESCDHEVVVALAQGGSIAGRVRAGARPPDAPRFIGLGRDGQFEFPRFAVTDLEGAFRFARLEPGQYEVFVERRFAHDRSVLGLAEGAMGLSRPEREVDVVVFEGQETQLDIDILAAPTEGPSARLSGRVTLNSAPAQGASVHAQRADDWSGQKSTVTDLQGAFDFGAISIGDRGLVIVTVTPRGMKQESWWDGGFHTRRVHLSEGETRLLVIDIRTGRLAGRVVRDADGAPVPLAEVTVSSVNHEAERTMSLFEAEDGSEAGAAVPEESEPFSWQRVTTDRDGQFSVDMLPAGDFFVAVDTQEYIDQQVGPIRVPDGGEPPPLVIRLAAAIEVSGTIVIPDAAASRFVWMNFRRKDGGAPSNVYVGAQEMRFTTHDLSPGEYEVDCETWDPATRVWVSYRTSVVVPEGGVRGLTLRPVPVNE